MKMLLEDRWVDRDDRIEVRNPESAELVDTVPRGDTADAARALAHAEGGARAAGALPVHERMRILHAAADAVLDAEETFARRIATEGIKTIREARKEAARAAETIRLSAEEARRLSGETVPFDQSPSGEGRFGWWTPAPVGVVGCITPFNDPLNLVAHKVGPGIAAGNAVIVKPDSKTPLSALALTEILLDAGVPGSRLQVVTGDGSVVGDVLVRDRRVRMISFTGGRSTGERIAAAAGLKKLSMELGSNSPSLVLEDADLDLSVRATVSGAFWAAGQNCLHVQRIFVHRELAQRFTDAFVARAATLTVGDKLDDATDMGPLVDEAAARRVVATVAAATEAGGHLLLGGDREGTFVRPTVLSGVPADAELAREEIYGPVTVIEEIGSDDEAIRRANAVDYGLQAGVFATGIDRALRVAAALEYGGVVINDSSDVRIDGMPFGGFKGSGLGREGVPFTVREMTEPKLVCVTQAGTS